MKPIILASQSARRKQLLELAEIPFEVISKGTDETFPLHLSINEIPIHIAREKAQAVRLHVKNAFHQEYANQPILAADTVVVAAGQMIGKPENRQQAFEILQLLQNNTHQVITGVVILHQETEIAFADVTEVSFHALTTEQIVYYIDKYEPFDKAGSYGIQEWIGVVGIKSINGDFYNVMGLPISRVVQALQKLGY